MRLSPRRLRRLPAVVLARPDARLFDAVRLFDPDATPTEGGIAFGAGIRLSGPHAVDAEFAARAGIPPGHAWVVSDSGPFQSWLIRGLARRFGGHAHLPQPVVADDASEVVIVHTPRKVPADELTARLGALLPRLTAGGREADGSVFLTSPRRPVRIRCDTPEVPSLRWLLPLALGPLRKEPGLHGYRFGITSDRDDHAVRLAAVAALELANGVGGIATDRDRFRIFEPTDPVLYQG